MALPTRREVLQRAVGGFGAIALHGLLADESRADDAKSSADPLSPKKPHHRPRAKRVIFLYMTGGVSHVDSFDPKPLLDRSIDMKLQAEDVITKIQQLEKNLRVFESGRQDVQNSTIEDKVESEIGYVTTQLQNLAFAINRLASMRSERILGRSGALYDVDNEPAISGNFRETVRSLVKFSVLGAVAGLLLGFFAAFFLALMNLKRNSTPNPEPSS